MRKRLIKPKYSEVQYNLEVGKWYRISKSPNFERYVKFSHFINSDSFLIASSEAIDMCQGIMHILSCNQFYFTTIVPVEDDFIWELKTKYL